MSKYSEVKTAFETINPEQLGETKEDQTYRYFFLMLAFELFGALDSISYSYAEMLKITKARASGNPTTQSASPSASSPPAKAARKAGR